MIRVERGAPPSGFEERGMELSRRFIEARNQDPGVTASKFWRRVRPELGAYAAELAERFHHKCAFCEARMEHVQNPHVEHHRPKGLPEFQTWMFDGSNWLLSCGRCNGSKWRHFPFCGGVPCLLDPTVDDPGMHLIFHREDVEGIGDRGRETVRLLGLDPSPPSRERASWLVKVQALLLLASGARQNPVQGEARRFLIWRLQEDAPFSAMTRAFVLDHAPKLANPRRPHPRICEDAARERIAQLVEEHREEIRRLV